MLTITETPHRLPTCTWTAIDRADFCNRVHAAAGRRDSPVWRCASAAELFSECDEATFDTDGFEPERPVDAQIQEAIERLDVDPETADELWRRAEELTDAEIRGGVTISAPTGDYAAELRRLAEQYGPNTPLYRADAYTHHAGLWTAEPIDEFEACRAWLASDLQRLEIVEEVER